jgi:hypothetical protein
LVFYFGYLAAAPIARARTLAFSVRRMNSLPAVTKLVISL